MSTTDAVSTPVRDVPPAASRRRPPLTRLSSGHLLMIVAGLLAALVNFAVLRSATRTVSVAVAHTEIPPGHRIAPGDFDWRPVRVTDEILATLVDEKAGLDPKDPKARNTVVGWIVTAKLEQGRLVQRTYLRNPVDVGALRTMSIPIDPAHAVGGKLQIHDRIDVIEVRDATARTIAMGVEVWDVGNPKDALGSISPYHVTIAADAATLLRIAAALPSKTVELVRSTGADPAALPPPVPASGASRPATSPGEAQTTATRPAPPAGREAPTGTPPSPRG